MDHQRWDMDRRKDVADVHVGEDPAELLVGAWACHEPLEPRPPGDEGLVPRDGGRLEVQVLSRPDLANEPLEEGLLFLGALPVRELRGGDRLRDRRIENQGLRAFGMRRREQHRHRSRASSTEHDPGLDARRIHDRSDVIALELEKGGLLTPVGQAHSTHVEQNQPREPREAFEEASPQRLLPHHLDVRPDTGGIDKVDRTVTDNLVGDRGPIRRLRVVSLREVHTRIVLAMRSHRNRESTSSSRLSCSAVRCWTSEFSPAMGLLRSRSTP
jgi:hypothetical protein